MNFGSDMALGSYHCQRWESFLVHDYWWAIIEKKFTGRPT